jgi:mannosyltransferase OCH1-like enzyme
MLYKYGGVYLDSDTRPLRSLDPLTGERGPWISVTSETWLPLAKRHTTVNNAAIGVPPCSDLVAAVWAEAVEALQTKPRRLSQWAGPGPWTRAIDHHPCELLDESLFPGVRWQARRKIVDMSTAKLFAENPAAYAVHEYDQSWNPNANPVHAGNALVDESRR